MSDGIPARHRAKGDLEEMRRLFLNEGLTLQQVAERMGVSRQAVHSRFTRAGIPTRRPDVVSLEVLNDTRRMYEDEGFSIERIARHFGIKILLARKRLARAGAVIHKSRRPIFTFDRDLMYALYIKERLSLAGVSERLGVSQNVVIRELRLHGIKQRPRYVKIRIDRDELYKLYVVDGFDQPSTARLLGVSTATLRRELKRHGIEFRHKGGKKRRHG